MAQIVCRFRNFDDHHQHAFYQRGAPKRFSKPIERTESLRPALRFRVSFGGDGADEFEVVR